MAALRIAHVDVTDPDRYGDHVRQATGVITAHGGSFVARGGRGEQLEGCDRSCDVVVSIPTYEAAFDCSRSDAYEAIVGDAIVGEAIDARARRS